jgi:hypothetical protein
MKHVQAVELFNKIDSIMDDFINSNEKRIITILGRPRVGKRYWIKRYLDENKIDYIWKSSFGGTQKDTLDYYFNLINSNLNRTIVCYEQSLSIFPYKKVLDLFNKIIDNQKHDELKEKFIGKIILLDDPYAKRSKVINEKLTGYIYSWTVLDFIKYFSTFQDMICQTHNISKKSIEFILSVYEYSLKNNIIKYEESLDGGEFSIYFTIQTALAIDKNDKNAYFKFPQKIHIVARDLLEVYYKRYL